MPCKFESSADVLKITTGLIRLLAYGCICGKDQNTWYLLWPHKLKVTDRSEWSLMVILHSCTNFTLGQLGPCVCLYSWGSTNELCWLIFFIYFSCTDQIGAWSFRSVFANDRIQADFEAPSLKGQVNCRAALELAELNVERTTVKEICERMKKLKQTSRLCFACSSFTQVNRSDNKWRSWWRGTAVSNGSGCRLLLFLMSVLETWAWIWGCSTLAVVLSVAVAVSHVCQ